VVTGVLLGMGDDSIAGSSILSNGSGKREERAGSREGFSLLEKIRNAGLGLPGYSFSIGIKKNLLSTPRGERSVES